MNKVVAGSRVKSVRRMIVFQGGGKKLQEDASAGSGVRSQRPDGT